MRSTVDSPTKHQFSGLYFKGIFFIVLFTFLKDSKVKNFLLSLRLYFFVSSLFGPLKISLFGPRNLSLVSGKVAPLPPLPCMCLEPEFVNLFKEPRNRFPAWRNRFLGNDPGLLKRLHIRALVPIPSLGPLRREF